MRRCRWTSEPLATDFRGGHAAAGGIVLAMQLRASAVVRCALGIAPGSRGHSLVLGLS